jgi:hypothetical protein
MGRVFLFNNFEASASRVCDEVANLFSDAPGVSPANLLFGYKSSVTSGDLDGDTIPEIIIGNQRGGIRMYNTQVKGVISGLNPISKEAIKWSLFPNPAKGQLHIRTDRNMQGMEYSILDIVGNVQNSGKMLGYENTIEIQSLRPGFYVFLSRDSKGNQIQAKFLVEE